MKTHCINLKDNEALDLLEGSVTTIWRPVKPEPHKRYGLLYPETVGPFLWLWSKETSGQGAEQQDLHALIRPCKPGAELIGKEAWNIANTFSSPDVQFGAKVIYKAGGEIEFALTGEQQDSLHSIDEVQLKDWFWKLEVTK